MDFEECTAFTFDPKIKNLLRVISQKDAEKFQTLTGKTLTFKKGVVYIDQKALPKESQDFTFSLIEILNEKKTWKSLDKKEKAEKFYDAFWKKIQGCPPRKKKVLIEILESIIREKKFKKYVIIKNDEITDIQGIDFEECIFENPEDNSNGKIIWKKNVKGTLLYSYV